MTNAENLYPSENNDIIEFQTKANSKVAGNDGKSQYTFLQLAEKKQIDYTIVNQKGYTIEEVSKGTYFRIRNF